MHRFLIVPVILLAISSTTAQMLDERGSLKGFKVMAVVIENLSPEVEKAGLSKSQLQTEVELSLRKAGISLRETSDPLSSLVPYLYLDVTMIKATDALYAVHVTLNLKQIAILTRDKQQHLIVATTWAKTFSGTVGASKVSSLRQPINDLVNTFLNDYLAANQK